MIIGTAGHIDHGKTSLVKALTGIDADRLKEEKARGITIDLGFAYKASTDGRVLGFVDVPGHEKLIRNMLAGATGIDHVMLVVAADDGPMPQTREHLAILDLLGLSRGVIALTKADLVSEARLAEVFRFVEKTSQRTLPERVSYALARLARQHGEPAKGGTIRLHTFYDLSLRIRRKDGISAALPLQVEVVDDGPGIPGDELHRAGERFFRASNASLPGSGIGLAIVRSIAERHRGRLDISRGDDGRGLAATIVLPITTDVQA